MDKQNTYTLYKEESAALVNSFLRGVYNWMAFGLALTAAVAYFTASSEALLTFFSTNPTPRLIVMFAPFVLAMVLIFGIRKFSPGTATVLFLVYSAINGLGLSVLFITFTSGTLFQAFAVAAGMFIAMSIYGLVTKRDLTSWGTFLFMGLIGIVIASIINIFVESNIASMAIAYIGVIVFVGLTAYDTQKLKAMGEAMPNDAGTVRKGTIMGAFTLYLDFLNLFLFLLQILGGSRE